MKTYTHPPVVEGMKETTYDVVSEIGDTIFIAYSFVNARGMKVAKVGKVQNGVKTFMSDIFVVERDADDKSEVQEMLEFESYPDISDEVITYLKSR